MKFNRGNYELFVIDFLEGKLSEEDHILFVKFLKDHPEINEEIKDIHNAQLQPDDEQFSGKHILKKNIKTSKYQDDFYNNCIAYLEGDLGSAEKINFENWISDNPQKIHELELFRKVYLKADMNITFSPKSGLKKRFIISNRIRLVSILTTAAAVIIFIIIFVRPTDIKDRNVITEDSINRSKVTIEKEIFAEEMEPFNEITGKSQEVESNNIQLGKSELDKTSKEQGAKDIEKISIEPVSSILAQIENHSSVGYNKLKQPDERKERNFDEYKTLGEYVNENILSDFFSVQESGKHEKITLWNLASNSLEGINNMTDGGYVLDKETNKNGNLKRISIETPLLGISIPVKNKQPQ
jgi:hypothetical protein